MGKFLEIARFEIRYQTRNPVLWVALAVFFLLGFGLTSSENVRIGTPGAVYENAPYAIAIATGIFSMMYMFVITAFVANAIVRDDQSGFAPIVRAAPVSKAEIVLGRFTGGLIIAWLGYLSLLGGMVIGTWMPWVDPETIGPNRLADYAWNYLLFGIPNVFFMSAMLFAVATSLRSMLASYIGAVLLVMVYLIASGVVGQDIENRRIFAQWEPFGTSAFGEITRYWTQAEMNNRLVEFSGLLAFNRIWVILLGFAFLALAYWRFTMTERAPSKRKLRKLARRSAKDAKAAAMPATAGGEAIVARTQSTSTLIQFMMRLRIEVRQVLTSPGLIVLCLLSIAFTAGNLWANSTYGTADYPTPAAVIDMVRNVSTIFLLMIAVFYGGELVWRERDRKLNELIDSTPVPSWVMTIPKIIAIFLILLTVNLVAAATGLFYQAVNGATEYGLAGYVGWFILPAATDALLTAILAVVVQVLSPNKYVGWGMIFIWFVGTIFLTNLGYSNPLYMYGVAPSVPLSDFLGAGSFWKGQLTLQFYWAMCAIILVVIAHLIWPRGTDVALRPRLKRLHHRSGKVPYAIAGAAALAMTATGAYAYHNIKVLNRYLTSDEQEKLQADYERKYLKYETLPQPSVQEASLDVQLYPKERRMVTDGRLLLVNRTVAPLAEVHVRQSDPDTLYPRLSVSGARLAMEDKKFGYRIFRFDRPLAPGATTELAFRSVVWRRGFRAQGPETDVIENGTFVNNGVFAPIIGMDRGELLGDRTMRRRQGLPAELRPAKLEDLSATRRNYIGSDWIARTDIRLTTDADQLPVAPGRRVSDTIANGRRTARFIGEAPMLGFFSIQSARYKQARVRHAGLTLDVLHHPSHSWNIAKMHRAMGASLDYYRQNFGPYQFSYARIIEFPGYASFAQAFAGTMPYSESIGFNANTNDPEEIDFTTYVIAHEIAHQYWAHQVIGANMQGGTMLSETLAQYSALMVMRRLEGPDKIRRFLKYELDNYLRGRKSEAMEELPLERVENQQYIHYRKGAVALYLLQERLGEAAVNRALSRFVAAQRFAGPPYPRSVDLIGEFRKEAKTPEQQQLITDLFERITLYDLKVSDASTRKVGNAWETTLTVAAQKLVADGKGDEKETALAEPIEVGLFTARPGIGAFARENVILLERRPVRSGVQKIVLRSAKQPTFAGVDPYNFYVDRNADDNVKDVTGEGS